MRERTVPSLQPMIGWNDAAFFLFFFFFFFNTLDIHSGHDERKDLISVICETSLGHRRVDCHALFIWYVQGANSVISIILSI